MLIAISVICLTGALFFHFGNAPRSLAQTAPNQVQKTNQVEQGSIDRLTQKCFQLLQQSNYQKMVATCTEAVNAAREVEPEIQRIENTLVNW